MAMQQVRTPFANMSWTPDVPSTALQANSTGINDVAVGLQASYSNTSGSENSAFGLNALWTNTIGTDNTGLGTSALGSNTTGSYNTAVGRLASYVNSTGSNNTSVGYAALQNSTASNNTAVGYQALYTNSTTTNNTAVGYQAGYNNVGSGNTFIGNQTISGSLTTTGSLYVIGPVSQSNGANTFTEYQEIIYLPGAVTAGGVPTTVITRPGSGAKSMFIDYQIVDAITGTNQRTGHIMANFNNLGTPTTTFAETVTADIGSTALLIFTTNGSPNYDIILTNGSANPYTFKAILRYF